MRVVRLRLPRAIFALWGLDFEHMLEGVKHCEILEIYQYDYQSILSKMRITFESEFTIPDSDLAPYFEKKLLAKYFYHLNRDKTEITCIVKQERDTPVGNLQDITWAFIPPVSIQADTVVLSIIIPERELNVLIDSMSENTEFKVLSNTRIEDFKGGFGYKGFSMPDLTKRQEEIIMHAIKRGYYETPKKISGKELADELHITYATFYEHVRKVERKIIKHLFG